MKLETRDRIIEILKFHGSMIGNDSEEAKELIKELRQLENVIEIDMNKKRTFTRQEEAEMIIADVCRASEIEVDELKSKSRKREFVIARQIAVYLIVERFNHALTWSRIGKIVGIHHSTAIHCHKVISQGIAVSDRLVMNIINRMNEKRQAA